MNEKSDSNESIESLATSLMVVGIVQGVAYFFASDKWRVAIIYSESWMVIALAVVFSVLAIRKVEVERSVFVAVTLFFGGLGGLYVLFTDSSL